MKVAKMYNKIELVVFLKKILLKAMAYLGP